MLDLQTPVQYVKGIGPRLAEVLAAKGIQSVDDLLHYLPFRYEDRLNPRGIAELRPGEMASVIAEVRTSGLFRTRRMPIFQMTAGQGRSRLKCTWFNATYLRDRFKPGQLVALYGKVEEDHYGGELQLMQPQFEILGDASEDAEGGDQRVRSRHAHVRDRQFIDDHRAFKEFAVGGRVRGGGGEEKRRPLSRDSLGPYPGIFQHGDRRHADEEFVFDDQNCSLVCGLVHPITTRESPDGSISP